MVIRFWAHADVGIGGSVFRQFFLLLSTSEMYDPISLLDSLSIASAKVLFLIGLDETSLWQNKCRITYFLKQFLKSRCPSEHWSILMCGCISSKQPGYSLFKSLINSLYFTSWIHLLQNSHFSSFLFSYCIHECSC